MEYGEGLRLDQLMESIDAIVPRRQLREAADAVLDMVPPPGADPDGEVRAQLAAMKELPRLLDRRKKKVLHADVDAALVTGSWQRLVFKTMASGSRTPTTGR
ncbi:hypothetical protein ACQEU3_39440 [Spirillospora sp. CA-253888]